MSYYTANPCADAERWENDQQALYDAAEAQKAESIQEMRDGFLASTGGDLHLPARFSVPYQAYNASTGKYYKRFSKVYEIMNESLDYEGGPQISELMALLCAAAHGSDVGQAARDLLIRMADKYAEINWENEL